MLVKPWLFLNEEELLVEKESTFYRWSFLGKGCEPIFKSFTHEIGLIDNALIFIPLIYNNLLAYNLETRLQSILEERAVEECRSVERGGLVCNNNKRTIAFIEKSQSEENPYRFILAQLFPYKRLKIFSQKSKIDAVGLEASGKYAIIGGSSSLFDHSNRVVFLYDLEKGEKLMSYQFEERYPLRNISCGPHSIIVRNCRPRSYVWKKHYKKITLSTIIEVIVKERAVQ